MYYNYGHGHQECLEHIKRYLIRSVEVESDRTWNIQMLAFVRKLMADAKAADEERAKQKEGSDAQVVDSDGIHARFSPMMIQEYKDDFNRILKIAAEEYQVVPSKKWFPDGKNLFERLNANQDAILGFLEDDQVDFDNNCAERAARVVKRKLAACMEFRGILNVIAYCEALSVIEMLRATDKPLLEAVSDVFRCQARTSDKLRMEKEHLNALKTLKESDENILKRNSDLNEKLEKEKDELLFAIESAKAEYEKFVEAHKAELEAGSASEEEKKLKGKCDQLEHRLYQIKDQLHNKNKELTFDKNHLNYVICHINRCEKNIASLEKKLEHEKRNGQQGTPEGQVLPVVDPKLIEEAQKSVDAAKKKMEEAQQGLLAAYALQREATTPLAYNETRDPQKAKDAKAAVEEARIKLEAATDTFTEARKNLDSVRKQWKEHKKKNDAKKKEAC